MINKLIIFGSNGMLGSYISKYFRLNIPIEVIALTRTEYDITVENISNLEGFLNRFNVDGYTCVINCVGLIPQRAQKNDINYFLINTIFPLELSKVCVKYNTKLICPTTDCVFSGKRGNYNENDFHDEKSTYGISKSLGEPPNATVIRTSIIGEELVNKCSFLEFIKNNKTEINGWDNHLWNGITCYQYCKVIEQIIRDNLFWSGIRHIYSPDVKSKYELAVIIKDVYNLDININKFNHNDTIDKTLTSIFDTNSLFNIPTLEEQIREQAVFKL
jgi:dTDP-4-dehydrorhamnose reductase